MESPLHRIEHGLQPWVSFVIMPLFAFSNAGVHILGNLVAAAKHPVTLGVTLGLLWASRLGLQHLHGPRRGSTWRRVPRA